MNKFLQRRGGGEQRSRAVQKDKSDDGDKGQQK